MDNKYYNEYHLTNSHPKNAHHKTSCDKHVNFSTNASLKKSESSSTSEASKGSFLVKKTVELENKPKNESVTKPEETSEDENEVATNSFQNDITDIMDETNSDILAFLSDMYSQDDYQPEIEDMLEDCLKCDDNDEYAAIPVEAFKKCCCSCHDDVKLSEYSAKDCTVKQVQAPAGTNITIPIYAAAAVPPNQNIPTRLIWPPNNQPYNQNRLICPQRTNYSNWNNNKFHQAQKMSRYSNPTQRSFPYYRGRGEANFNNQNNENYEFEHEQIRNNNDTLNFDTELDFQDNNYLRANDNVSKAFNSQRLNRVGSPMNWEEIFKFLD